MCRKHDVCYAIFYNCRVKFGGMEVLDAKKPKALDTESTKLKYLLVEQIMDVSTLKETLGRNF